MGECLQRVKKKQSKRVLTPQMEREKRQKEKIKGVRQHVGSQSRKANMKRSISVANDQHMEVRKGAEENLVVLASIIYMI